MKLIDLLKRGWDRARGLQTLEINVPSGIPELRPRLISEGKAQPFSAGEAESKLWEKIYRKGRLARGECLCSWTDLLGFGRAFYESDWDPSDEAMKQVYARLSAAYRACYSTLTPQGEFALSLNDGIVRIYQLEYLGHIQYLSYWLGGCIQAFIQINRNEHSHALPGAKMVLTHGARYVYGPTEITLDDFVFNYTKKDPTKRSSIATETGNPQIAINPTSLQMNVAFSKAYLLDNWGSRIGVTGPNLFIDESVFALLRRLSHLMNLPYGIVWEPTKSGMLFALPSREDHSRYHIGFELDKDPISVDRAELKTKIWRAIAFYPCDEDVADFRFEL